MANYKTSYQNADSFGRPAFEVLDTFTQSNLTAGAEPGRQQPVRILLADNQNLAQFTVVGLNAANRLVKATYAADGSGIKPIGVLEHAVASGANNTTMMGEVVLTGVYNIGADDAGTDSPLVWDATFDTREKKRTATVGNPNLIFRSRLGNL